MVLSLSTTRETNQAPVSRRKSRHSHGISGFALSTAARLSLNMITGQNVVLTLRRSARALSAGKRGSAMRNYLYAAIITSVIAISLFWWSIR